VTRAGHKLGQIVLLPKLLERLAELASESGAIGIIEVANNLFKIDRGPGYDDIYLNASGEDHNPPKE
jgi:hypothetical protein